MNETYCYTTSTYTLTYVHLEEEKAAELCLFSAVDELSISIFMCGETVRSGRGSVLLLLDVVVGVDPFQSPHVLFLKV